MNKEIRDAYVGVMMQHKGQIVVLQRDEEIENACITFLAALHDVPAGDMAKAIEIVSERLKTSVKPAEDTQS